MKKCVTKSALFLSAAFVCATLHAAAPSTSSGVTGSGNSSGNAAGTGLTTPARSGQLNTTPNSGTAPSATNGSNGNGSSAISDGTMNRESNGRIIDNTSPTNIPNQNNQLGTPQQSGRVESVNPTTRTIQVRDQHGNLSDITVGDGVIYGPKGSTVKSAKFSDIKNGDQINYSVGTTGQADRIGWSSGKTK